MSNDRGWIAIHKSGKVLHFSEPDGWEVVQVVGIEEKNMTTERERFEAWAKPVHEGASFARDERGHYYWSPLNVAWAAWQAALAQPAQPVAAGAREIAWLIETATGQYWCGGKCGWTPSPNLACRFARAEDAHAAREWLRIPPVDVRVTEHVWLDAAPQPAPAALTFTLREAEELLHMFGGEQGEITVRDLPEGAIKAEDGDPDPSPAGLYGHMTEYPEEGCVYLGSVDVLDDYEPQYTYRAPPAAQGCNCGSSEFCIDKPNCSRYQTAPAAQERSTTTDGAEGQPSGRALADMETATRERLGPPIPSETQAEPPSTPSTAELSGDEFAAYVHPLARVGVFTLSTDGASGMTQEGTTSGPATMCAHGPSTLSDAECQAIVEREMAADHLGLDFYYALIRAGRATVAEDAARKELREISAALNDPRDNLTMTTAQCVAELREDMERYQNWYRELLNAVARKYPNETRHQTALRYIREREQAPHGDMGADAIDAARGKP